jgi:hypothetical protein
VLTSVVGAPPLKRAEENEVVGGPARPLFPPVSTSVVEASGRDKKVVGGPARPLFPPVLTSVVGAPPLKRAEENEVEGAPARPLFPPVLTSAVGAPSFLSRGH